MPEVQLRRGLTDYASKVNPKKVLI